MASALLSSSIFPNSAANSRTNSPRTNSNLPLPRGGGILLNPLTPLVLPGTSSPFTRSPRPNTSLSLNQNSATSEYASSFSGSPHPRSALSPLPRTDSNSSSQSGNTDSNGNATQNGTSHSRANSIRKIRFAPLPDPRRDELAENAYMTDSPFLALSGGLSLPSSSTTDDGLSPVQQQQLPATSNTNSALGLVHSAGDQPAAGTLLPAAGAQGLGLDVSAIPDDTASDYGGSSSTARRDNLPSKPKRWSKLLGPLLGKTTSGGGSSPGVDGGNGRGAQSDDESMWRTTSRDSMASNTSNEGGMLAGLALTRRRTASGADSRPSKLSLGFGGGGGVPMKRVQSLGTPVSKTPLAPARRRNQRMLNGRVYGAPRSRPFDNVQDTEPEFVEWGHGGAGSVKNAGLAGGRYAGVQSRGNVSIGATSGGTVADDDDGSGMAWVKRRREQREREKAEEAKKAAEANEGSSNSPEEVMAESESGATIKARDFVTKDGQTVEEPESVELTSVPMATSGSSTVTPRPSGTPTGVGTPKRKDSGMTITGVGAGVGSPLSKEMTINVAEDEHHVVKAVALPAPHHHHHHHNTHVQHPHAHETGRKSPPPPIGATPSEGSSVTGDDDDDDDDDDDSDSSSSDDEDEDPREEDSDTEEEMGEREDNRKTSLCAGVEKISRHRDQPITGS